MSDKFSFQSPTIPQELHQALWAAQDAYDDNLALIKRLEKAKSELTQEIVQMEADRESAKSQFVDGFEGFVEGEAEFPQAAKDAKVTITELATRIAGHEEVIPEYVERIDAAVSAKRDLADEINNARNAILRFILTHIPSYINEPHRKHSFIDLIANIEDIDFSQLLILYVARERYGYSVSGRYGIRQNGFSMGGFFEFVGRYFSAVSDDEAMTIKEKLDALIWGDRLPEPVVRVS